MEKTLYPLTTGQKIQHAKVVEFKTEQVTNIGVCMTLKVNLDFGLLKKCIQLEFERYDCLRVRFTKMDQAGKVMQYIAKGETRDIELINLENKSWSEIDSLMNEWSSCAFDEPDKPVCKFTMVALPENYRGIFVLIDHRIIDSCGVITMVNDIMELYSHYVYQTPMPEPLGSFEEALKKDLQRENNEKKVASDRAFWQEQIALGEPIYTDVTGTWKLEKSRKAHNNPSLRSADRVTDDLRVGKAVFHLEEKPAKRMFEYCLTNNVSMTNLLLMGLRTYLSKMNGNEKDVSVKNYVSRRSTRLERTSGGSRTHCYPCRTIIEPDTEFLDGVYQIQELQNKIYRHANYDQEKLNEQMKKAWKTEENTVYESMALTYQPLPVRLQNEQLKGIPVRTNWCTNGMATQKVYLTVMHSTYDLGLEFYFKFQRAELSDDDIEKIYYYLMKIIFMGIDYPDITVGEILETV